ncbi:nucleotide exchange factor GrpE [Liquorilactobacillus capillatus]|uniref:Protein GrpE n=1 Tax=Liquorilactobacillus capillatus DSM 19910 TaxID=1423731 RepID=A0A0R1M046_9LACO|nr:nucleotide exchange factor GrpE [Liquorilactobacillus capillatus]KRL01287.1 GrpE protein [Liquorilactobacillus capillatus DSM 19910]
MSKDNKKDKKNAQDIEDQGETALKEEQTATDTTDHEKKQQVEDEATTEKEASPAAKNQDLQQKIAAMQAKYAAMEDKYLRAEAEMANMHTRFKKEQEKLLKYDGQNLAKDVLPVIDNLNRALQIEVEDEASKQIKHGIELVYKDMEKALTANDIIKIDALGQSFDPTKHQAVKSVQAEEGQKSETVVEVFQDGYMLKDRVLRPAMVVVAQ